MASVIDEHCRLLSESGIHPEQKLQSLQVIASFGPNAHGKKYRDPCSVALEAFAAGFTDAGETTDTTIKTALLKMKCF